MGLGLGSSEALAGDQSRGGGSVLVTGICLGIVELRSMVGVWGVRHGIGGLGRSRPGAAVIGSGP